MLRVDDPDGGEECFAAGTSTTVQWTRANTAGSLFVYFSPDAGATWNQQSGRSRPPRPPGPGQRAAGGGDEFGRVFVGEWDGSAWKSHGHQRCRLQRPGLPPERRGEGGNLPGAAQSRWDYYYFDLPAGTRLSTVEILGLRRRGPLRAERLVAEPRHLRLPALGRWPRSGDLPLQQRHGAAGVVRPLVRRREQLRHDLDRLHRPRPLGAPRSPSSPTGSRAGR